MDELVVLVDEKNTPVGIARKDEVHTGNTPLHRAFSLFLFNSKNELLLTKRASTKKTFPDVWTNTTCGHPGPGESVVDAAKRRLKDELGIDIAQVKEVALYRYRFADKNGIVENEICPILMAHTDESPNPNPKEVSKWAWMDWKIFLHEIKSYPQKYSPWSVEEAKIIEKLLYS